MPDKPLDILRKYWGFEQFRPLQEDVIRSVLEGNDTLALMPTGGGKSICYQVPALAREGICIVVSPLIALMQDQVQHLRKRNIPAAAVHSGMHPRAIDQTLDNCIYGNVKFLYLSPERLRTELAQERIRQMKVNLIAVDEAHCISQWGYDFRPTYLEIANIRPLAQNAPLLALTATATPPVVKDIQEKLQFRSGKVFRMSFERPNLAYVVLQEENKLGKLLDIVRKVAGTGIVYVRSRRLTEKIARFLSQRRIRADFYHAGLDPETRTRKQEAWMQGRIRVMACTNAFGMGIDKPDVRFVVHMDLPDSLEAYFQEAGRAGRDGKKSFAVLLFHPTDADTLQRHFEQAFPPEKEIRRVYQALGSYYQLAIGAGMGESFDFDLLHFSKTYQLDPMTTFHCLKILEQSGWLSLSEAVYIPSTLKCIVSKEALYDYQLKHPQFDPILKSIFRLTAGAFTQYVNIREAQFARFLQMPVEKLVSALHYLHRDGILDYRPQKNKPQLTFLLERVDAANLEIDTELYRFRKQRHKERMQAAIAYATQRRCRSALLRSYFGEEAPPRCGICDVCLEAKKKRLSPQEVERYLSKFRLVLRDKAMSEAEFLEHFPPKRHTQILAALQFLLEEGYLSRKDGQIKLVGGEG